MNLYPRINLKEEGWSTTILVVSRDLIISFWSRKVIRFILNLLREFIYFNVGKPKCKNRPAHFFPKGFRKTLLLSKFSNCSLPVRSFEFLIFWCAKTPSRNHLIKEYCSQHCWEFLYKKKKNSIFFVCSQITMDE